MIELTLLNGEKLTVNCDLIEFMNETPDTVVFMSTGRKQVVKESIARIKTLIIEYKQSIFLYVP